jgi:hypothetical protein
MPIIVCLISDTPSDVQCQYILVKTLEEVKCFDWRFHLESVILGNEVIRVESQVMECEMTQSFLLLTLATTSQDHSRILKFKF